MASLGTVTNQFCGLNPLLHSQLPTSGQWDNFHVNHISDLTRFLQRGLRPLGYRAQAVEDIATYRAKGMGIFTRWRWTRRRRR